MAMASLDFIVAAAATARVRPRRAAKVGIGQGFEQFGVASGKNSPAALRGGGGGGGGGGSWTRSPVLGRRDRLTARFRFHDGGNGDGDGERRRGGGANVGGMVLNAAVTGALAYLTFTGKLGWLFDAVVALWLFFILAPIIALIAYIWFMEREIITSNCPNCGNEFQVFEFAVKDELQLCPYCTQPFKVDNKVFVRDGSRYGSNSRFNTSTQRNGTRTSYSDDDTGGGVVDVEAEVLDD